MTENASGRGNTSGNTGAAAEVPLATEGYARPPRPLEISGNMATTWREWLQQYEWFEAAREMHKKPAKVQVGTLMSCIGLDAINIFNSFTLTEEEKGNVTVIKKKFEEYFAPKANITFERYKFNKLFQAEGESFDDFLTRAKIQIKKCEYGELKDDILRDKIIIGINNDALREKLLSGEELKLEETVKKCKANELAIKQLQTLQVAESAAVNVMSYKQHTQSSARNSSKSLPMKKQTFANTKANQAYKKSQSAECSKCGTTHVRRRCPAYNKSCKVCQRVGHFARVCTRSRKKEVNIVDFNAETVNESNDDGSDSSLLVFSYEHSENISSDWYEQIKINNKNIKIKLDTGAQCNLMSQKLACELNAKIVQSSTKKLVAFNGSCENVIGETVLNCKVRGTYKPILFKIIKQPVLPMFGRKTCEQLNLVMRVQELSIKNDLYDGLGCVKNFVYDVDLIENPTLVVHPARKIPHAIRDDVKRELDKMVSMDVLKKTHEATPAVSPMVVIRQKNKIRLCLDPSDLNKNILRRHHPLRTIEEIAARIKKSKFFTLLDLKKGFWQVPVTERTSKYLTMATPWGRYSFKRLPFGLASAPEIFQKMMSEILENCQNTECAMDDVLIHAETQQELTQLSNIVIQKLSKAGLKLNKEKCIFNAKKVKFLGHILSSEGVSLDPDKIAAINQLKQPQNKTELKRLLGMATYLSKFIKNFSAITHPLRELLKENVEWEWTQYQTKAFETLKKSLSTAPVLRFYNPNKEVILQVDASQHSLGAALLQDDQPIAYASKSLTETQQKYSQIEKEALAMQFGLNKFREYAFGNNVIIETDHKPLESITKKNLHSAPQRLQRILLEVMQYSPIVKYRRGKDADADALSRDCINTAEPGTSDDHLEICSILQITEESQQKLLQETLKDTHLQNLKEYVEKGWPQTIRDINPELKRYWTFRDEIGVDKGLLFKSGKIIVPQGLRDVILKTLHQGHYGVQRTLSRAREQLFWINMTDDITHMIESCSICQRTQPSKAKEPLILKDIPELPWEITACDIFHFSNNEYLLIADSYSGYYDFAKLKTSSAREVIHQLKIWFATHGIPLVLETDNGPQFAAKEFKMFSKEWGFRHQTSSPYFPRSNGLAERYVQMAKQLLRKCQQDGSDIYLALLNYRNTPRSKLLRSPNQRLYSRLTRTNLPINKKLLKPAVVTNAQDELLKTRRKQKVYADKSSKISKEFQPGDQVRLQMGHREWISGNIVKKLEQPRSYLIKTSDGLTRRRNSNHISSEHLFG